MKSFTFSITGLEDVYILQMKCFTFYITSLNDVYLLQVKSFTFYDIVLDFILMDAFDDLANPPSSVITVVQNRWLSNGFKETVSTIILLLVMLSIFINHFGRLWDRPMVRSNQRL